MSESGKNRRDRAAAARDAAAADERRRERMVRIIGAITVLVVVVGIIAVALVARGSSGGDATATPTADPGAAVPSGALPSDDPFKYGVPVGTATDVPVLEVWEDFQCPACAAVEEANGQGIVDLATEGKVRLIWRMATFLDRVNDGGDPAVANSSTRAAAAFGCAVDAGKAEEFHKVLFDNHPANEGDGFTDEQLISFGSEAGLTGAELDTYTQCVTDGTFLGWATNSGATFQENGHPGTPFALLDGVELPTEVLADPAALPDYIASGGGAAASASPEPSASAS